MTYPTETAVQFQEHRVKLKGNAARRKVQLGQLVAHLRNPRAVAFLNEGILRRMALIQRALDNIYSIYPPDRARRLDDDELTDVAINLQAFGMNVYGLFDNVAWVCMLDAGGDLDAKMVGLFRAAVRPFLPETLAKYVADPDTSAWFNAYAKRYRDSTAHRIPPYLPPSALTPDDAIEHRRLNEVANAALSGWSAKPPSDIIGALDEFGAALAQMKALGSNCQWVAISASEPDSPVVQLHPQLLTDWMTVQELLEHFATGLAERLGVPLTDVGEVIFNE